MAGNSKKNPNNRAENVGGHAKEHTNLMQNKRVHYTVYCIKGSLGDRSRTLLMPPGHYWNAVVLSNYVPDIHTS